MTSDVPIQVHVLTFLSQIDDTEWDACNDGDPFTTHRFLKALEDSGSIGPNTGWTPQYLQAVHNGQTIAVAPMYGKTHSQGEYIFDHNFAHAYENAGGNYYPKMQIAVPHTPATGRRFLSRPGYETMGQSALMQAARQVTANQGCSSLHVTFCTADEARSGAELGLLPRVSQQFHWRNDHYADFDAFLATLSSRKRKNIRKERTTAQAFGGQIECLTGDQIEPHHWDAFWIFYQDTGARKWGTPYLTRDFFRQAQAYLRDDILLVMAKQDGEYVAGALNFIGPNALFGRYWGCISDFPCLHFELCYYQAIDYAIAHGLSTVEAGAQGSHKLARGYLPVQTHSLHWFRDPGFADAVGNYLKAERDAVDEDIEILTSYGPFKKHKGEEQQ
ncbi:MAG: GNAT family N-acetyltransferase [Planktomarina sp.]